MALIHDVIDSDVRFAINPVTRAISNQGSGKLILIQGDHNSERFSFEIPRKVEGHDMSLCNVVRIHFINTNSRTRETSEDIYEPKDLCVSKEDPNLVHFSWLISGSATVHPGGLAFAIEFQCTIGDKVEYSWHTAVNSTISISDGINNSNAVIENYSDILTEWWLRLYANSTLPIEIHSMESFAALGGQTKPNTLYLFEDDPTLGEILKKISDLSTMVSAHNELLAKVQEPLNASTQAIANLKSTLEQNVRVVNTLQSEMRLLSNRVLALENHSGGTETPDPGDGSHTHSYTIVDAIVDATCKTQGYTVYRCSCGDTDTRDYVTALGHKMQETVVEPTCTEEGYTEHVCTRDGCGYSYIDSYTEQTGHTWSYYDDDSTGTTVQSRQCTRCGLVETDVGNACANGGDHSWTKTDVTDATCTTPAYQNYECSVCHETYQEAIKVPLGHNWSGAIYDALGYYEPTCDKSGYAGYVCRTCGEEKSETVPALGHNYEAVEDSSQSSGYRGVCTVCGDELEDYSPWTLRR